MTTSIREAVLAAALAALKTMSSVPAARVYRSRSAAFGRAEFPCAVLEPVTDDPGEKVSNAKLTWDFTFVLHVGVQAKQDEIADQLADSILTEAHAKVMGDATLDDLLIDRNPGAVAFQFNEADATLLWSSQQFRVKYRSNLADITA
jgi:hypothetical protein